MSGSSMMTRRDSPEGRALSDQLRCRDEAFFPHAREITRIGPVSQVPAERPPFTDDLILAINVRPLQGPGIRLLFGIERDEIGERSSAGAQTEYQETDCDACAT